MAEPLIPTRKLIRRKYRSGSLFGRIARHFSEHRSTRKVVVANMAAFAVIGSYLPMAQAQDVLSLSHSEQVEETVIQAQNILTTQKSVQYPLEDFRINQRYSYFHPAVDFGANIGDSIKPIKAGAVVEAGYSNDGYGNTIVVDHGKGLASRYAHLDEIEVDSGETVTTNTEIGTVGITGRSTGPHLHLEVLQDGTAINPLSVIPR